MVRRQGHLRQPGCPQHATGAGYVLFTQAAMNAPWKNDLEPYIVPDTGPGPFIETDARGYAIAASASDEAGLSVTSAQIQEATADSLDGSSTTVKNPGNLADLRDEAYFSGKLPAGSTDTDKHSTSGRIFALKTVGGGVLAFYALTAQLTLAPAARPDLPGQHPRLLLLQPDPNVGHRRVRRAICHLYPAGSSEPADPRRRIRHHRTRVDDRRRVTGRQFPQLARGRPRIRRRLTRRMRG